MDHRAINGRSRSAICIEAAYVGNKATHLEVVRNINALSNQYLSTLDSRDNTLNSYLTAAVPNPFFGLLPDGTPSGLTGKTIARQQLLLPFPEFGTITTTTNEGSSWYHSLQVRSEKRFSQGLTLVGNYTFSKWMQATELLNAGDLRPTRMISDQDVPHRIAIDWIYQFPFGKGHRVLSGVNGFTDRLVNGWEFTGIWAFQSGLPLNFAPGSAAPPSFPGTTNADYFFNGTGTVALTSNQRSLSQWFNTSAFVTAASAQPVSHLQRNPYRFSAVRGPRQNNVDVSLIKDVRIREGQT